MIQYLADKRKYNCKQEVGMDNQSQSQQPISDDQELAKVLAGVNQQSDDSTSVMPTLPPVPPAPASEPMPAAPLLPPAPASVQPQPYAPVDGGNGGELDSIKQQALGELRPLVDKLNVSPEEKFDTYLLLLRSTDDKSLVEPAHEAARNIQDEARRAQALLDIIKEIDFLSQQQ